MLDEGREGGAVVDVGGEGREGGAVVDVGLDDEANVGVD